MGASKVIRRSLPAKFREIIRDMLAPPNRAAGSNPDEDPEVSVEVDPTKGTLETRVQLAVKLKAMNDDDPPKVRIFPDVEITVHIGTDGNSPSMENQLNVTLFGTVGIPAEISEAMSI